MEVLDSIAEKLRHQARRRPRIFLVHATTTSCSTVRTLIRDRFGLPDRRPPRAGIAQQDLIEKIEQRRSTSTGDRAAHAGR